MKKKKGQYRDTRRTYGGKRGLEMRRKGNWALPASYERKDGDALRYQWAFLLSLCLCTNHSPLRDRLGLQVAHVEKCSCSQSHSYNIQKSKLGSWMVQWLSPHAFVFESPLGLFSRVLGASQPPQMVTMTMPERVTMIRDDKRCKEGWLRRRA
ncbi:hypothetical protein B0F90DRAFT_1762632 [Multifurca ochricompacta]|uniref:Uncharacterized protein n=1 Tax=Multifurca ochricompacta TaxID=376703 RepID=A0AAD4QK29_9AGAM|nr:hypothetical protein B0F90DRAFT_1762632 [Multifurca ochricompacta]